MNVPVQVPYVGAAAAVILSGVSWGSPTPEIKIDWFPDQPDVLVSVWQYPGVAPLHVFEGAPIVGHARLQIRARATTGQAAVAAGLAHSAFAALSGIVDTTISAAQIASFAPALPANVAVDCRILAVESADMPTAAERAERERPIWTVNLGAWVSLQRV